MGDRPKEFVMLTSEQLEELLRKVVNDNRLPLLVDKQQLAQQLGCSPAQVDALRRKGLPTIKVGSLARFEPAKVVLWLKERGVA